MYRLRGGVPDPYCFLCPTCKDKPRVLIGDATSATIQAQYYDGAPITETDRNQPPVARGVEQQRAARCFCTKQLAPAPRRECRQLLARLSAHIYPEGRGSGSSGGKVAGQAGGRGGAGAGSGAAAGWTAVDARRLEELAGTYGAGPFVQAAHSACSQALGKESRRALGQLLASLASESPVISYLPSQAAAALAGCMAAEVPILSSEAWAVLIKEAQLVAGTLAALGGGEGLPVPAAAVGLLETLCGRTALSCEGPGVPAAASGGEPSCQSDECLRSGLCCGLPKLRSRPSYEADTGGSGEDNKPDCNHAFQGGRGKTGGVFTWFCEHGVCYGFYMIPKAEGRNEAFSFLTCYFAEAPRYVIYDFGCALQEYCLNRAPSFFKDTIFVVDRFHWMGHKSCAKSYSPSLFSELDRVNTSIAEQCNAELKKIRQITTRMNQVHFMLVTRFFLDAWNRKKIEESNKWALAGLQLPQQAACT